MTFSVTKNGKPLSETKYKWDEETKTFSTKEDDLVLDFSIYSNVTFVTGNYCNFKTGYSCTFKTEDFCTFKTGSSCVFNTGYFCTFKTGNSCTFKTGSFCFFKTGDFCTFNARSDCEFTVGKECSITRRDAFEVIIPDPNKKIKLGELGVKGFYNEEELLIKDIIE